MFSTAISSNNKSYLFEIGRKIANRFDGPIQDNVIQLAEALSKEKASKNWHKYAEILLDLPSCSGTVLFSDAPSFLPDSEFDSDKITQSLQGLKPWRKGPFQIGDIFLDAEWQSNLKWARIQTALSDLSGKSVLDIGSNSGYYMFRLLELNPEWVLGIDPFELYFFQFLTLQHFFKSEKLSYLPIGLETLAQTKALFDCVLCMGILYHQRDPHAGLRQCYASLNNGGKFILETLILETESKACLVPEDRYARMPNVYTVPSLSLLKEWLLDTGFTNLSVIHKGYTTLEEQRATAWTLERSLVDALDADDLSKTIEGYQAPFRVVIMANK